MFKLFYMRINQSLMVFAWFEIQILCKYLFAILQLVYHIFYLFKA